MSKSETLKLMQLANELFQRGYMEIENIRDEISGQLSNTKNLIFANIEYEEEE